MQIHELTRRRVKEGIGSELADMAANAMGMGPAQTATRAATGLTKQGYGAGYQAPSAKWEDKYDKIVQDPAVKQYVAGLAKAWIASQQVPVKEATMPAVTGPVKSGLPTPAEQEKFQQKVAAAAGKPAAAAAPAQPGAAQTAPAPGPDNYGTQFVNFTDAKLASKIPGTYETVTMDMVRKLPGIKGALDKKLANVESTVGTPQHAYNVEEYLKVAVAGVQAVSQQIKNEKGVGATPGAGATTLGLSTQQIRNLRAMAKDPNAKEEIKQLLGL
jgi:uncharacterized protein (UPF0254 family)